MWCQCRQPIDLQPTLFSRLAQQTVECMKPSLKSLLLLFFNPVHCYYYFHCNWVKACFLSQVLDFNRSYICEIQLIYFNICPSHPKILNLKRTPPKCWILWWSLNTVPSRYIRIVNLRTFSHCEVRPGREGWTFPHMYCHDWKTVTFKINKALQTDLLYMMIKKTPPSTNKLLEGRIL